MEVWYSDISKIQNSDVNALALEYMMQGFPVEEIERINRLRNQSDKLLSALGIRMVKEKIGHLEGWKRDEFNKPVLDSNVNFNISHSGDLVVTGFSEEAFGIDIEKIDEIEISDFNLVMTEDEQERTKTPDQFFELWTRKEAVLKEVGSGFSIEPKEVKLGSETAELRGEEWYFYPVKLHKDYKCYISSKVKDLQIDTISEFILEKGY